MTSGSPTYISRPKLDPPLQCGYKQMPTHHEPGHPEGSPTSYEQLRFKHSCKSGRLSLQSKSKLVPYILEELKNWGDTCPTAAAQTEKLDTLIRSIESWAKTTGAESNRKWRKAAQEVDGLHELVHTISSILDKEVDKAPSERNSRNPDDLTDQDANEMVGLLNSRENATHAHEGALALKWLISADTELSKFPQPVRECITSAVTRRLDRRIRQFLLKSFVSFVALPSLVSHVTNDPQTALGVLASAVVLDVATGSCYDSFDIPCLVDPLISAYEWWKLSAKELREAFNGDDDDGNDPPSQDTQGHDPRSPQHSGG